MEHPRFLQSKTIEEHESERKNFETFRAEIDQVVAHASEVFENSKQKEYIFLNNNTEHFQISAVAITLEYRRLQKDGGVVVAHLQKGNQVFSCILKCEKDTVDQYRMNIARAPAIETYLPYVYETKGEWAVFEKVSGIEEEPFRKQLAEDDVFREKFCKNASDFVYTIGTNRFVTGDTFLFDGHNVMADRQTGALKLIELDSLAQYPSPGYRGARGEWSITELITREIEIQARSLSGGVVEEPESLKWRSDVFFQFLSHLFQKIHPEDLKVRYRYVATPSGSKQAVPQPGFLINPAIVDAVISMDIERFTDLFKNNWLFVDLPDTPKDRVILTEDSFS